MRFTSLRLKFTDAQVLLLIFFSLRFFYYQTLRSRINGRKLKEEILIFYTQIHAQSVCTQKLLMNPSHRRLLLHMHAQKNTPQLIYFNGIIKAQLNDTAIHNCLYNYYNLENVIKR